MQIGPYILKNKIHDGESTCHFAVQVLYRGRLVAASSSWVFEGTWTFNDLHIVVKLSRSSLQREWVILRRTASPYGIPDAIEWGNIEGWDFLVTEFLGTDLSLFTKLPGPIPPCEITTVVAALVIHNLEHIHHRGIIHCDIKPSNITNLHPPYRDDGVIAPVRDWTISIVDFSLACTVYEHAYPDPIPLGRTIGSLLYMSPWIHRGYRPCRRDDLFSAAVTFLVLCRKESQLKWYDAVCRIGTNTPTAEEHAYIASLKETADLSEFTDLPDVFREFYHYAVTLEYGEDPVYSTWFDKFRGRQPCLDDIAGARLQHLLSKEDLTRDQQELRNLTRRRMLKQEHSPAYLLIRPLPAPTFLPSWLRSCGLTLAVGGYPEFHPRQADQVSLDMHSMVVSKMHEEPYATLRLSVVIISASQHLALTITAMGPPCVEIIKSVASDAFRSNPDVVKPVAEVLSKCPGIIACYAGSELQEPQYMYVVAVWETIQNHLDAVADASVHRKILQGLGAAASSRVYLRHVTFSAEPFVALNAPVTEFATWDLKAGQDREQFLTTLKKLISHIGTFPDSSGLYKGGWGAVVEDEKEWMPATHEAVATIEELKGLAELDLKHAALKKYL
ncbi:hypothetical protein NM688_g8527 [Phlebia brevispora]|uniref:Uncharacterized protein n=1 Tax=Phlebia brevispora TaxID=194682 RepID=A0ACC1RQU1_9APHY|nr:hypothetical protein NM688_g8527 [Phlebia brevispora]